MVGTLKMKFRENRNNSVANTLQNDSGQIQNHLLVAPWPEWNDAEINAEKWESKSAFAAEKKTADSAFVEDRFESPLDRACVPPSIVVHEWRRAANVYPPFTKILPEDANMAVLDLISSNGHILHSEVMRHIVASITNLHHLALIKPFDELAGDNFVPNGGRFWKPWNHVYALCKVGKGTTHKPEINKGGKYVVRLHYLGRWRRITVDDLLPLDEFGRILLPRTTTNELWSILLSKAILRIAALTWTPQKEVFDMNAVTFFTGWFMVNFECEHVPPKDVWLVCQKALMSDAEEDARYKEASKLTDVYSMQEMAKGEGDRIDPVAFAACEPLEEGWGSVAVFAAMSNIGNDLEVEVEELGPCMGHQVVFSEARIIRDGDDGGQLPIWKTFRWKSWALKTGLIQPEHLVNVKNLRVFAPMKKWLLPSAETLILHWNELQSLQVQVEERLIVDNEQKKVPMKGKKRSLGGKSKKSGSEGKTASKSSKKSEKSKKGSRKKGSKSSTSTGGKNKKQGEIAAKENTDPWMNFNVFSKYLMSVQLFFRTSSFKYCKSSNDFHSFIMPIFSTPSTTKPEKSDKKTQKTTASRGSKPAAQPVSRQLQSTCKYKVRNSQDCFYLGCDTPTAKKFFFTISAVSPSSVEEQEAILKKMPQENNRHRPEFSIILLGMADQIQSCQPIPIANIVTEGTRSALVQFGEGVVSLRIWVTLPPRHFVQVVSQTEFQLVGRDDWQNMVSKPSESLKLYGARIYDAFANLKRCLQGSPDHLQAVATYHAAYLPGRLTALFPSVRMYCKFVTRMHTACERVCIGILYDRLKHNSEQFYIALKMLQDLVVSPSYGLDALYALDPGMHEEIMLKIQAIEMAKLVADKQIENKEVSENITGKGKAKGKIKEKSKGKSNGGSKSKSDKKTTSTKKKDKSKKSAKSKASASPKNKVSNEIPHILFEGLISSGIDIIKKIVEENPDWAHYYPFRNDLRLRLYCRDFVGTAPVSAYGDWFPLVRLIVNISTDRPSRNFIFFSSSAALSFYHIVNNDTKEELVSYFYNLSNLVLLRNTYGYTIFGYGFCDNCNIKEHSWKIHVIAKEDSDLIYCCRGIGLVSDSCISDAPEPLIVKHVYGHYIPNKRNRVFTCILSVQCSQVLTIRVSTNNSKAKMIVKIMHDFDKNKISELIYEKKFQERVTLPSMPFFVDAVEGDKEQEPKLFLIEATSLDEFGWELTELEKNLIISIKERVQRNLQVFNTQDTPEKSTSDFQRRSSSLTKDIPKSQGIITDAAYWCVQVVVDASLAGKVTLELSRRKEIELRRLKEEWERADPGRHIRAMQERQKYLEEKGNEQKGMVPARSKLFASLVLKSSPFSPEEKQKWKDDASDYGYGQELKRGEERRVHDKAIEDIFEKRLVLKSEQKETNYLLKKYLDNKEAISRATLNSGYKLRETALLETVRPVVTKGKKEKKGKKK